MVLKTPGVAQTPKTTEFLPNPKPPSGKSLSGNRRGWGLGVEKGWGKGQNQGCLGGSPPKACLLYEGARKDGHRPELCAAH